MNIEEQNLAALKTATQVLIRKVGGLEAAASACRLCVSRLSECQSRENAKALLPIDVVRQLEAIAGEPVVSKAIILSLGLTVAAPVGAATVPLGQAVADMARAAGDAAAAFMVAQSGGGIDAAGAQLRERFSQVRAGVDAALAALPMGGGK